MSTGDPLSTGSLLLHFRLIERVGTSVWKAEDTRNGKSVAVKVLTRQLPREAARRDALVRDIRLGAAIYHAFIVPIQEIVVAGDALLMVMEWLEVQPITRAIDKKPVDRPRFFRMAYQIGDALKLLHGRGFVHGNINGDSILVGRNDHVRLAGFNVLNILGKAEAFSSAYQQKGNDLRSVAYMSPEQISGQQVDARTDVFSFGIAMYEMATGRLPHQAPTPADLAHKVVAEAPPSPKAINPAIDSAVLSIIGKCVFKDPFSRYREAKLLVDDIVKADPEAQRFAIELSSRASVATAGDVPKEARKSLLLIGQVANYEALRANDPGTAERAAARMQQVLGEAVYLFDGQVVDPFGPRLVGELPSVENALEAGRKGEFDFSPEQQGEGAIEIRLMLHAGEVRTEGGTLTGEAVTKAAEILPELPSQTLFISEEFAKIARGTIRLRDAGARRGMKLYTIAPAEPKPAPQTIETLPPDEVVPVPPARGKLLFIPIAAAAAVVLIVGAWLLWRPGRAVVTAPAPTPVAAKSAPAMPTKVAVQPFTVEGDDPSLVARANAVRLAVLEILRSVPELQVMDAPSSDTVAVTATVRNGAAGPEMATANGSVALADAAGGITSILQAITARTRIAPRASAKTPDALNAYAEAVAAQNEKEGAKTETNLRAAMKADPDFLPAQLLAMRFYAERGSEAEALEAAKRVVALHPDHTDAARRVAQASLESGDLPAAFSAMAAILRKQPNDLEALNVIARYAVVSGDRTRYDAALARLARHPKAAVAVHEPDHLVVAGKIEAAINQYYDIEVQVPDNPALSLKIGRIAVLRHTLPVAQLELEKLEKSDPSYGAHILKAYLAAYQRQRAVALRELEAAKAGARPADDYWTAVAEVYAMFADTGATISALEQAATRREPAVATVPRNTLFSYLESDERFQRVRHQIVAQQDEIRSALARVTL